MAVIKPYNHMKEKQIKLKLTQKQVLNTSKNATGINPYKRVFTIESMTNAISVGTGDHQRFVGDNIEAEEAEYLCAVPYIDVTVVGQ